MNSRMHRLAFLVLLAPLVAASASADGITPLPRAHSHNDYLHDRPLLDALAHGFCGVEVDIFLVDGELLVGHSPEELHPSRSLETLYLVPLKARVASNDGRVYRDGPTLTLLVDIKSEAESTYAALRETLVRYSDILTVVKNGQIEEKAVAVVISGNRPREAIAADHFGLAGIDGRLSDLTSTMPSSQMPLISDRWTSHFGWLGDGPMPSDERQKLHDIVTQAHEAGRRVRFWATPERSAVWRELLEANVDLINTDDLSALREFLLRKPES